MKKKFIKIILPSLALLFSFSLNACSDNSDSDEPRPDEGASDKQECVDLGLSVKWATCNIGAKKPSEYGDYFAWGETETKGCYGEEDSEWTEVYYNSLQSKGVIDTNGNLTPEFDVATVNWGDKWRMPTPEEIKELINNCSWKWTSKDGNHGYMVTGPNGKSIFLPAAGRHIANIYILDNIGYYWSAAAYNDSDGAYILIFNSSRPGLTNNSRCFGYPVRPVTE